MKMPITDEFLRDILEVAGAAGDVLLTPHTAKRWSILLGTESPIVQKYRESRNRQRFDQLIYYLKRKNYIQVKRLKGKRAVMLTPRGFSRSIASKFIFEKRKKRKDGKWIMVAFDVPQNHRKARALLTSILKNLGYQIFQQSNWVTPYDVSEQTEQLFQMHDLDRYVKIFLIEKLD